MDIHMSDFNEASAVMAMLNVDMASTLKSALTGLCHAMLDNVHW